MIRLVWVGLAAFWATAWFGGRAIVLAARGVRGPIYSRLTGRWARMVLRAARCRVVVHGGERLVAGEPAVVVSNHVSWFDVPAKAAIFPGPFSFVAKKELRSVPLFGKAMEAAGHLFVDRRNRQAAIESMRDAGRRIHELGSHVVVYPEGTRSRSGRLQPFKKGAFMMAVEAGVPIIPTVVIGSYDIMRPDEWRVRPNVIHVHFGQPVSPGDYSAETVDALVERVRGEMAAILARNEALPPEPGPALVPPPRA